MNYFDGLTFGAYNYLPSCRAWIERDFEYGALNFCRSGRISWGMNSTPLRHLHSPVAWWTVPQTDDYPAPRYVYGAQSEEQWEHFYVTFSGPRLTSMMKTGLVPAAHDTPHFCFVADCESFAQAFFHLFETLNRDGPHSAAAAHQLEGLLLALQTQAPPATLLSPLQREVQAWVAAIRAAPQAEWDIEQQARKLSVSSGHLRRIVTQLTGVAPHRFISEQRLGLAALRLRDSSLPIKVIVSDCGFQDVPHFTRLFTRRYGISPAAYRRETQLIN